MIGYEPFLGAGAPYLAAGSDTPAACLAAPPTATPTMPPALRVSERMSRDFVGEHMISKAR